MGTGQFRGAGGVGELSGESVQDLFGSLEEQRGVQIRLEASTVAPIAYVHVDDPGSPIDLTGDVTLREGFNSQWQFAQVLTPSKAEMVTVGRSFNAAGGLVAAGARAPLGAVLGLRNAFSAVLTSAAADDIAGSNTAMSPSIPTRALAQAAVEARLRRSLAMPLVCTVTIAELDLWKWIRPGVLVSARCTEDPFGDFASGGALINECTFSVTPPYACTCAVQLWSTVA